MPFALVTLGLLMVISAARNTHADFGRELMSEFTGQNNFTYWLAAIGGIGALGYVKTLQPFSRIFIALIIIAMFLANGGIWSQLTSALRMGPTRPQVEPDAAKQLTNSPSVSGASSSGSVGGSLNIGPAQVSGSFNVASILKSAANLFNMGNG